MEKESCEVVKAGLSLVPGDLKMLGASQRSEGDFLHVTEYQTGQDREKKPSGSS